MASIGEILQTKNNNDKAVRDYLTKQEEIRLAVVEFLESVELEKARNRKIRSLKSLRNKYVSNILAGIDVDASRNFAEEINRTLRNMGAF